jgi:hypothetical protein
MGYKVQVAELAGGRPSEERALYHFDRQQKAIGSDDPFDIDIAKRRARCPSGFLSTQCNLRSFQ